MTARGGVGAGRQRPGGGAERRSRPLGIRAAPPESREPVPRRRCPRPGVCPEPRGRALGDAAAAGGRPPARGSSIRPGPAAAAASEPPGRRSSDPGSPQDAPRWPACAIESPLALQRGETCPNRGPLNPAAASRLARGSWIVEARAGGGPWEGRKSNGERRPLAWVLLGWGARVGCWGLGVQGWGLGGEPAAAGLGSSLHLVPYALCCKREYYVAPRQRGSWVA